MNKSDLSQLPNYCTATAIGSIVSTESVGHRRHRCCIYSHTHIHIYTHELWVHVIMLLFFIVCARLSREGFFLNSLLLFCFVLFSSIRRYILCCEGTIMCATWYISHYLYGIKDVYCRTVQKLTVSYKCC